MTTLVTNQVAKEIDLVGLKIHLTLKLFLQIRLYHKQPESRTMWLKVEEKKRTATLEHLVGKKRDEMAKDTEKIRVCPNGREGK